MRRCLGVVVPYCDEAFREKEYEGVCKRFVFANEYFEGKVVIVVCIICPGPPLDCAGCTTKEITWRALVTFVYYHELLRLTLAKSAVDRAHVLLPERHGLMRHSRHRDEDQFFFLCLGQPASFLHNLLYSFWGRPIPVFVLFMKTPRVVPECIVILQPSQRKGFHSFVQEERLRVREGVRFNRASRFCLFTDSRIGLLLVLQRGDVEW